MIACNNHNMRNPMSLLIKYGVTHVMIVACYHPLPLSACMLNFDLVSILFGTSSSVYILQYFSENVFTLYIYICLH